MSTTHKHCYDMKAQTDNAEHVNDNRFSILFLWVKDSNNKDNIALEEISTFRNLANKELRLQTFFLYYRETGTITKFNFEATKFKLQVSFALWLAFRWHILD